MADPSVISTDEIKENILKCDRCEQQFDSDDRIPRVLPCQHSFCSQCLEAVWSPGSKLACPSCSQLWDVRHSVAETFPLEFVAMKFVVFVELKSKKGRRLCTDCSDRSPATHHCLNCQVYICEEGLKAHKRFKKQNDHKILSIAEILRLPENYLSQTDTCNLHPGSTLDLFCEKSTCMKPVCPSCAMIQHKEREGHEIRDLQDVYADEKNAVTRYLERLKVRHVRSEAEMEDLEKDNDSLEAEQGKLEARLDRAFTNFVRTAMRQKEELRQALESAVGDEQGQILDCISMFRTVTRDEGEYSEYCQKLMVDSKPVLFLTQKNDIKEKLEATLNTPLPMKPNRKEIFLDLKGLNDLTKKMAKLGEVIYLDADVSQWKPVIEITDGVLSEEMIVVRVFLFHTGSDVTMPRPPQIKAIIEDSTGLTTRQTLDLVGGDPDTPRSDGVDSPGTSRYTQRNGYSSGVQQSFDSPQASHRQLDLNRYEDNTSPVEDGSPGGRYSPVVSNKQRRSLKKIGSQRSIDVTSSSDLQSVTNRGRQSHVGRHESKTSLLEEELRDSRIDSRTRNSKREADDNGQSAEFQLQLSPRTRSGATNRLGNSQAVYEMRPALRSEGPHRVSFRLGGYPVTDDAFTWDTKTRADSDLDRSLHFLTMDDPENVRVKTLKCPAIALSEDSLNRDQCTITTSGRLVKSPSSSRGSGSAGFSNYCGTTGTRCFTGRGALYWHVNCNVRVLAKVAAFGKMILEAAVAHSDVLDNSYCVWETPRAWSLVISICSTHKAVCVKVVHNSKVIYDRPVMQCEEGSSIDLDFGFLLDLDSQRLVFIDAQDGSVLYTFSDIDVTKSLWPVFGVYNRYHFSVELGVTSGQKLEVNHQVMKALENLL